MKLRNKLNLKKAAIISLTSAVVVVSGFGGQKQAYALANNSEPSKTVTNYDEESLIDDLLTAVDGYSELHDYVNVLKQNDKKGTKNGQKVEEPKVEEAKTEEPVVEESTEIVTEEVVEEETTEVETEEVVEEPVEVQEEIPENTNPYQQIDSEGDTFVFIDPNGNFVQNSDAPEKYDKETEEKEETNTEVSEEAIASVREFFAGIEETVVGYINAGDFEGATNDLTNTITTALDFLFYEGKINEFTKKQVDKDTIIYIVNELNNNMAIASDLNSEWKSSLAAKYIEAMNFLNVDDIDKFDAIGAEIKANNPEEDAELEAETSLSK